MELENINKFCTDLLNCNFLITRNKKKENKKIIKHIHIFNNNLLNNGLHSSLYYI